MIQVACDSILQIGHLLDRNVVNWGFYHRSSKCFSDDRHHKPTWEWWFRGVWQCIANSSFFGWWWYEEKFSPQEIQNAGLIISTIRPGENDDLEVSLSILQMGHLLGRNGVKRKFHHKGSKMLLYENHQKTSWQQWFSGAWQYFSPSTAIMIASG